MSKKKRPRPPKPPGVAANIRSKRLSEIREKQTGLPSWFAPLIEAQEAGEKSFLQKELDDTTAIITATSAFDRLLGFLIILHVGRVPSTANLKAVFDFPGPLSSFAAKIDLCYLMGHLTPEMKHDLNVIKSIRNDFCHSYRKRSFADLDIKLKCQTLKYSSDDITKEAKLSFENAFKECSSEGRQKFSASGLVLLIFLIGFIQKRMVEFKFVEAHRAEINVEVQERFSKFVDGLRSKVPEGGESTDQPPTQESTAPEKIQEALVEPPPASQE